ncbi:LOW QUALITY PROTEIN: hypothetical protein ACHAXT_004664 [Thalassiosira profunda]
MAWDTFQFGLATSLLSGQSVFVMRNPPTATKGHPITLGPMSPQTRAVRLPLPTTKDMPNARKSEISRNATRMTLMTLDELLLILFVRSYKSIHVTAISKSMRGTHGKHDVEEERPPLVPVLLPVQPDVVREVNEARQGHRDALDEEDDQARAGGVELERPGSDELPHDDEDRTSANERIIMVK